MGLRLRIGLRLSEAVATLMPRAAHVEHKVWLLGWACWSVHESLIVGSSTLSDAVS
jgi:hypothetical protein